MSSPRPEPYQTTQADVDCAVALLNRGDTFEAVQSKLAERGAPPGAATGLLNQLLLQAIYADAVELLNAGNRPNKVKRLLAEKGLEQEAADAVVDDVLARHQASQPATGGAGGMAARAFLRLLDAFVFVVGIGLYVGNRSGAFPTFPFAGFLVMGLGGLIWGAAEAA